MKSNCILYYLLFISSIIFAQKPEFAVSKIADSLMQNANAVVRLNQLDIAIEAQQKMTFTSKRAVTVLNESGMGAIDAEEYYDKKTIVENIFATVYDAFGVEIKKIKRKDFKDQCVIDGYTILSDNRIVFLRYIPVQYPFTIVFESKVSSSNTAFLPNWHPLYDYFVSVEKSVLSLTVPVSLGFKKKEINFDGFKIKKTVDLPTQIVYVAEGFMAQKAEDLSPSPREIFPTLMMGLNVFNLEGVDGKANSWQEFGKWYYDAILPGTADLSEETVQKMILLVGNETDPIKKAKKIYQYVQEKSRYVSIQVGIGGWKPMLAKDVDRLGYGDCKALSNYTRALLNAVGVLSYNTLLYGSSSFILDFQPDFTSMQGNHMILCIPNKGENIFLECTSQDDPFGFQANFTDDRNVLIIKPEGGEIVRTAKYQNKDNLQQSTGQLIINENGDFEGTITIETQGSQYGKHQRIENKQATDIEAYYKEYWDNISNLKIDKNSFENNKEKVVFTEKLKLFAANYGVISNQKMMFEANAYNKLNANLNRIRNRKNAFEIARGYIDKDEISISLPQGFSIEYLPEIVELNNKFGEYKTEIIKKDNFNLTYKRHFFLKKGSYSKSEYEEFRQYMEQISRNDNAKIILTKNI